MLEILQQNAKHYGMTYQRTKLIEELSELIQALTKETNGLENNVEEEIADVEIMLEQYKYLKWNYNKVRIHKRAKIKRIEERLKKIGINT